jgi:hypothetical protein
VKNICDLGRKRICASHSDERCVDGNISRKHKTSLYEILARLCMSFLLKVINSVALGMKKSCTSSHGDGGLKAWFKPVISLFFQPTTQ